MRPDQKPVDDVGELDSQCGDQNTASDADVPCEIKHGGNYQQRARQRQPGFDEKVSIEIKVPNVPQVLTVFRPCQHVHI